MAYDDKSSPFLFAGTQVWEGAGTMLVLAVGANSQLGKVKLLIDEENPPTPLQTKLTSIANEIGEFGLYAAIATFVLMCLHYLLEIAFDRQVNHSLLLTANWA